MKLALVSNYIMWLSARTVNYSYQRIMVWWSSPSSLPHMYFFQCYKLSWHPSVCKIVRSYQCFVNYSVYPGKDVLRWLIIVVSSQRPVFDTWAVYVYARFIVEKLAYERFFFKFFTFPLSLSFRQCSIKVFYSLTIFHM